MKIQFAVRAKKNCCLEFKPVDKKNIVNIVMNFDFCTALKQTKNDKNFKI